MNRKSRLAAAQDPRWQAVAARDRASDGKFYYSVRSTGVYCRPSCRARLAKPENVGFHATCADAERAGFRPCRRCRPDQAPLLQQHAAKVADIRRPISATEEMPTLQLRGMTPIAYRGGGADGEIRFAVGQCSLGAILAARSDRAVCAILLGDDPDALALDLQDRFALARLVGDDARSEEYVAKVVGFVEAPGLGLDLPLDIRGTAFQQRVWQALRDIPVGATATYAAIAARIGSPGSVRAVARACAANAIAVAVPCHRVVRSDGALSGYRWGVERKRALLQREAAA